VRLIPEGAMAWRLDIEEIRACKNSLLDEILLRL
jgi:hypothetical protein